MGSRHGWVGTILTLFGGRISIYCAFRLVRRRQFCGLVGAYQISDSVISPDQLSTGRELQPFVLWCVLAGLILTCLWT